MDMNGLFNLFGVSVGTSAPEEQVVDTCGWQGTPELLVLQHLAATGSLHMGSATEVGGMMFFLFICGTGCNFLSCKRES